MPRVIDLTAHTASDQPTTSESGTEVLRLAGFTTKEITLKGFFDFKIVPSIVLIGLHHSNNGTRWRKVEEKDFRLTEHGLVYTGHARYIRPILQIIPLGRRDQE